jgi:uncharacterized membrane protein YgcG
VIGWRDKRSINVDYALGCTENASQQEKERAEYILVTSQKIICILCNQALAGNKKSLRRHQRESKKHIALNSEIMEGKLNFPSSDIAMSMPIPLPSIPSLIWSGNDSSKFKYSVNSSTSSSSSSSNGGGGSNSGGGSSNSGGISTISAGLTGDAPYPRPFSAASSFTVTMPCALAWKVKTGIL